MPAPSFRGRRGIASVARRCKRDASLRDDVVASLRQAEFLRVRRGQYCHLKSLCAFASAAPRPGGVARLADAVGMLYRVVKEPHLARDLTEFFRVEANMEQFAKTVLMSAPFADPLVRQLKLARSHVEIAGSWKKLSLLALAGLILSDLVRDKKTLLSTFTLLSVCRPAEIDTLLFVNMLELELVEWKPIFDKAPAQALRALHAVLEGCDDQTVATLIIKHIPTFDAVLRVCAKFDLVPRTEVTEQLVDMIRRCPRSNISLDYVLRGLPAADTVKLWAPDGSIEAAMVERARGGDVRAFSWLTSARPAARSSRELVEKLIDDYQHDCARAHTRAALAALARRITLDADALEEAVERWEATLGDDAATCPLTCRPIVSPLVDTFGRTFERLPLLAWVARSGTHPLTRERVTFSHFTPGDQIS